MAISDNKLMNALPQNVKEETNREMIPFGYDHTQYEHVNLNSGALRYESPDLHLPGRNGLDLVISRVYDSSKSNKHEFTFDTSNTKKYYYALYRDSTAMHTGGPYTTKKASEEAAANVNFQYNYIPRLDVHYSNIDYTTFNHKTTLRDNTQYLNDHMLGFGWKFRFPSVETVPVGYRRGAGVTYSAYLVLEDGRSFNINGNVINTDDYKLKDIELRRSRGTLSFPTDGGALPYEYIVTFKDGRKYYMGEHNIAMMEDRFGNKIHYRFSANAIEIVDTYGTPVTLSRSGGSLRWYVAGAPHYAYEVRDNMLYSATNPAGETTRFNYQVSGASARIFYDYSGDQPQTTQYCLLSQIVHPSGATSNYTYRSTQLKVDTKYHPSGRIIFSENYDTGNRFRNLYVIASRNDKEVVGGAEATRNQFTYSFTHSAEKAKKANGDKHFEYQYDWYVSKAVVNDVGRGLTESHIFNKYGLCTETDIKHGQNAIELTTTRYGSGNNDDKLPTLQESTRFGTHTVKTTWLYTPDQLGNPTSIAEVFPADESLNQTTTMTYGASSILTGKKYQKDASTQIEEAYALDGTGRVVTEATVKEGGGLKQRTQYFYDGAWNLTTERRYYDIGGGRYHDTAYAYTQANCPKPTRITTGGIARDFTYDAYGRVKTETDGLNKTTYNYDGIGRVTDEIYADGAKKHMDYTVGAGRNAVTVTDERGIKRRTEYTPLGKVGKVVRIHGGGELALEEMTYDNLGRLQTETVKNEDGTARRTTTYTYDHLDRPLTKTTAGAGFSTATETFSYRDAVEGRYFVETGDAGGAGAVTVTTITKKDQRGNVVEESVAGNATAYDYDKLGNRLWARDPNGGTTRWAYDFAGRVLSETKPHGGGTATATTAYDALGNKTDFVDFNGNRTRYEYDALGRLRYQTADFFARGDQRAQTEYVYDNAGNIRYQYVRCNADGQAVTRRSTEYTYDRRNRVVDTIQRDGAAEYRTRTEYDAAGNKTAVYTGMVGNSTAGASKTTYTYDDFGNVRTMTDPRSNALASTDPQRCVETYEYDATGRLTAKVDRNGSRARFGYDGMDRVTSETVTMAGARGSTTSSRTHTYNALGQKTQETVAEQSPDGATSMTTAYTYDSAGRLDSQTDTADGLAVTKRYGYDKNGNRVSFQLLRGGATELSMGYRYDAQNRMAEVLRDGAVIASYGYDQNGNRTALTYPGSGISTAYAYNAANLVTSLTNNRGEVVSSYRYAYYLDGNQRTKTAADGKTVTYTYDSLGRLTREACSDGSASAYTYDRFGNRARMVYTGVNAAESYTTDYEYHPNNWLLTETKQRKDIREVFRYQYDKNGSQCYREWEKLEPFGGDSPGQVHFEKGTAKKDTILELRAYNGFGQLTWLYRDGAATFYRYRPDGLRHQKRTGADTTTHLWDGQNIVMELTGNNTVKSRFYRGINLIAQRIDANDFYYLFNAHGDVVQRTNAGGVVAKSYEYDAFGVEAAPEPLDQNPFRYCGEYFDKESEGYYLRARYYDPKRGRFSSEDTTPSQSKVMHNEQELVDPLSLNLYTYCHNNPVLYHDKTGNSPVAAIIELVEIILFLITAIAVITPTIDEKTVLPKIPHIPSLPEIAGMIAVYMMAVPQPKEIPWSVSLEKEAQENGVYNLAYVDRSNDKLVIVDGGYTYDEALAALQATGAYNSLDEIARTFLDSWSTHSFENGGDGEVYWGIHTQKQEHALALAKSVGLEYDEFGDQRLEHHKTNKRANGDYYGHYHANNQWWKTKMHVWFGDKL